MTKKIWLITQRQISERDIDSAVISMDPEQLSEEKIFGLHGRIRLRIQNATGPASIFGDPASRNYFRELHKRWPWAGYFLRLAPITINSPADSIVDLSLFMSLAFCHCDNLTYCQTKDGVGLRYDLSQLSKHFAEVQGRAAELAAAVGISDQKIRCRENLIAEAVASFFASGKAIYAHKNQNKKK